MPKPSVASHISHTIGHRGNANSFNKSSRILSTVRAVRGPSVQYEVGEHSNLRTFALNPL